MEKPEILKKFLERGLQLDFESLDFFSRNQDKIDYFFQKILSSAKPTTITISFISDVLQQQKEDFEILKVPKVEKNILTVDDLTAILNNRYNFMKKLLGARIDLINLISVNKITPKVKRFSVIVTVTEKQDDILTVVGEDETGEHKFFFNNGKDYKSIFLDDVVGLVCTNNEKSKVEKIIWPDLSLKREINKTAEDCLIAISNTENDLDIDTDKINKKIIYDGKKLIINKNALDFPTTIKLSEKIIFLLVEKSIFKKYSDFQDDEINLFISLLKKRNLDPTLTFQEAVFVDLNNDQFIIDPIPDIFVVFDSDEGRSSNYKGTTILTVPSLEKEKFTWVINLKTRETKKLQEKAIKNIGKI